MSIYNFMKSKNLDALIVTNLINIRFLTGFSGSNALLLVKDQQMFFITDSRYQEQARQEIPACIQVFISNEPLQILPEKLSGIPKIGVEGNYISALELEKYKQIFPSSNLCLVDLDELRIVKSDYELSCIKKAAQIADEAFTQLLPQITVGTTEIRLAALLEFYMRQHGSEGTAFDTIVASGERSALPHAHPGYRELGTGDFVTFDFGATYKGYRSDTTRTVVIGSASAKHKEIYHTVLQAQTAALDKVQSGVAAHAVDKTARDIITSAGYGEYFGHSTGHGLGLMTHEAPRISSAGQTILAPNMVITIEPGIYLPDFGGVRIEDLLVVTDTGCEILTSLPKALLEL